MNRRHLRNLRRYASSMRLGWHSPLSAIHSIYKYDTLQVQYRQSLFYYIILACWTSPALKIILVKELIDFWSILILIFLTDYLLGLGYHLTVHHIPELFYRMLSCAGVLIAVAARVLLELRVFEPANLRRECYVDERHDVLVEINFNNPKLPSVFLVF